MVELCSTALPPLGASKSTAMATVTVNDNMAICVSPLHGFNLLIVPAFD